MKRVSTAVLVMIATFVAVPVWADNISLNESQIIWPQTTRFVTGVLFMCVGAPGSFFAGPCADAPPSDIVFFDNAKNEVAFISNADDTDPTTDPADIPFGAAMNNPINPRFVLEPQTGTLIWQPGPNDPGFYGAGKTWTITSDSDAAVPEPSSVLLLTPILLVMLVCRLGVPRRSCHPR